MWKCLPALIKLPLQQHPGQSLFSSNHLLEPLHPGAPLRASRSAWSSFLVCFWLPGLLIPCVCLNFFEPKSNLLRICKIMNSIFATRYEPPSCCVSSLMRLQPNKCVCWEIQQERQKAVDSSGFPGVSGWWRGAEDSAGAGRRVCHCGWGGWVCEEAACVVLLQSAFCLTFA